MMSNKTPANTPDWYSSAQDVLYWLDRRYKICCYQGGDDGITLEKRDGTFVLKIRHSHEIVHKSIEEAWDIMREDNQNAEWWISR